MSTYLRFATGKFEFNSYVSYEGVRDTICGVCEPEIAAKIKPVWGLDDECEMNSVWRDSGVENMWIILGTYPSRPVDLY